jgi:hypothetical protein
MKNNNDKNEDNKNHALLIHKIILIAIYTSSLLIAYIVLFKQYKYSDLVSLLSVGAMLATFGSAISTIGLISQNNLYERIKTNISILEIDIRKISGNSWRRWPFLPRFSKNKLLDNSEQQLVLKNPKIPFNVGTHTVNIDMPTVQEDFFDLPLLRNYLTLFRYKKSMATVILTRKDNYIANGTNLTRFDEYLAYLCIYDMWKSILKFRISKYVIIF